MEPRADRPWGTWISLALLVAAALHALRIAAVLLEVRPEPAPTPELVRWHVGTTATGTALVALAAGAIGSGIALALRRRPFLAVPLAAAVFLVPLTGLGFEDRRFLPARLPSLAILAFCALVLGYALARIAPRRLALPVAALLFLAVPALAWFRYGRVPPVHRVRDVVREIALEPDSWTIVSHPDDRPPHAGVLTPTIDWSLDGGDLPSIVMPPPCEVRFDVRPEDGPVFLRASAGLDHRIRGQLLKAPVDCAVVFEIAVNGKVRFATRISTRATDVDRVWRHAGGAEGLPLVPGDTVALRTSMAPEGFVVTSKNEIPVGFGRIELERAVERPFVRATEAEPSVLLIVMDTLRADELSCYGNRAHETPVFDALAGRGLLHERAYATSSWTWPSTASILTGLWPETHNVVSESHCYLDRGFDTLAEVLGREDFVTAAFACNPLLDPGKGFDQGFGTYVYSREFTTSGAVVPDVRAWLARNADARFFLYLHLIDPHRPVDARPEDFARLGVPAVAPPGSPEDPLTEGATEIRRRAAVAEGGRIDADLVLPPDRQRWIRESYSAGVLSADHYVGEVLRALEELGIGDTTLVAFTSDHGEELFDHGHLGHGQSLHQELVRVPLILAGPGVPRGVRASVPVSNRALFETLAVSAGASIERGVDLRSPADVGAQPLYFSTESGWWWNTPRSPFFACQDGTWILHAAPLALPWGTPKDAEPGKGLRRLYDLARDPGELVDRSAEHPEVVAALEERWARHVQAQAAGRRNRVLGAGDATRDLLRRFGYTGGEK